MTLSINVSCHVESAGQHFDEPTNCILHVVTAPFERLRTMMMADARNTSLVNTARRMWATGGLPGLWRGNMISVVKVMPQSAIQFAVLPVASPKKQNSLGRLHAAPTAVMSTTL